MNPMLIAMLVGAGAGLIKGLSDQKRVEKENKLARQMAATIMRHSPWTGMKVDPMNIYQSEPDILGNMFGGAFQGARVMDMASKMAGGGGGDSSGGGGGDSSGGGTNLVGDEAQPYKTEALPDYTMQRRPGSLNSVQDEIDIVKARNATNRGFYMPQSGTPAPQRTINNRITGTSPWSYMS